MIAVEHLRKQFGRTVAVADVSFRAAGGEAIGLLGPNGSGKTTIMRTLAGYFPPTAGRVCVAGIDVAAEPLRARTQVGYLPENAVCYPDMRVGQFLTFCADVRGLRGPSRRTRLAAAIDGCGLAEVERRLIGELSKGYRQRVGLAQAMIHNPEILILDEPTIGLDPNQVVDIRHLIKMLGREKTVILSTHILSEVQATCNRAVIINRGKIVADSTLADLQRQMAGKQVINLELDAGKNGVDKRLLQIKGVEEVRETFVESASGHTYRITASAAEDPRSAIFQTAVQAGWVILGLSREIHSLEDVFHKLTME